MESKSRRHFIRSTGITASLLLFTRNAMGWVKDEDPHGSGMDCATRPDAFAGNRLAVVAGRLVNLWGSTLLSLQINNPGSPDDGLIIYPPENKVHGRIGDTFYPFLHLASTTGDQRYVAAARRLYEWMERTVSQEDGSWLNEPLKGSWKGTTVFTSIALAEAIIFHGHLLDEDFKKRIKTRLTRSGDYIFKNFNMDYGNVNYPVAGSYCLSLLGELLHNKAYTRKGRELAHAALPFFSDTDHFLTGEGTPYYEASAKGCYSVDLGYNVEESLPSLILYARLTGDHVVLDKAIRSMRTHAEFMLPDGGWDNSWGTRNYKWTYWGSRTSDGCQPAFALMGEEDPMFYEVALKNTLLLEQHTHNGILYDGPHYHSHGIIPCLHHTFCHLKALVAILDQGIASVPEPVATVLPRAASYGSKFFKDIQTWLVATGDFRATVTGYDRNYKGFREGHASGGSLTMLWHEKAGIIAAASMNRYQLYEAGNMQEDNDPDSMPLTPRIEYVHEGKLYSTMNEFEAVLAESAQGDSVKIVAKGRLADGSQNDPANGRINYSMVYLFSGKEVEIEFAHDGDNSVRIIFPIVSASTEPYQAAGRSITIMKPDCKVDFECDKVISILPTTSHQRIFNFVPGLEAIPLLISGKKVKVRIAVASI